LVNVGNGDGDGNGNGNGDGDGNGDDIWESGKFNSLYYTESKTWVVVDYERQQVLTAHLKDKESAGEGVEGATIK
jgi:hypothetical protein